eukprot:TRINITY_DN5800_c0_g1_i1.p2 TRINITY_DN5800_c0_g1~~TRINITY_DN5800_c0_g1_i1.p2  ORF type:complete len:101 (+),score=4.06 TRINITY_DN5800_c0_g1_i1:316-618(+)
MGLVSGSSVHARSFLHDLYSSYFISWYRKCYGSANFDIHFTIRLSKWYCYYRYSSIDSCLYWLFSVYLLALSVHFFMLLEGFEEALVYFKSYGINSVQAG